MLDLYSTLPQSPIRLSNKYRYIVVWPKICIRPLLYDLLTLLTILSQYTAYTVEFNHTFSKYLFSFRYLVIFFIVIQLPSDSAHWWQRFHLSLISFQNACFINYNCLPTTLKRTSTDHRYTIYGVCAPICNCLCEIYRF